MPYSEVDDFDNMQTRSVLVDGPIAQSALRTGIQASTERSYGLGESIVKGTPLAAADLVDSVVSSVTFGGVERGSINQNVLNAIGAPGLNQFYRDNKDGISTASGVVGLVGAMIATEGLAGAMASRAVTLNRIGAGVPWFGRALTLDAEYATALSAVRASEMSGAGNAIAGEAAFLGRAEAARRFKTVATLRGARTAVIGEGVLALSMNQNEFLYSDSTATNVALGLLGVGIGGGVERIMAKYQMARIASEGAVVSRHQEAFDPVGAERKRINFWDNKTKPTDSPSRVLFDEASSLLLERQHLQSGMGPTDSDPASLVSNRDSYATTLLSRAREKVAAAISSGLPHDGRTAISLGIGTSDSGITRHINKLMDDPTAFVGIRYMGQVPEGLDSATTIKQFEERLVTRGQELRSKLTDLSLTAKQRKKVTQQLVDHDRLTALTPVGYLDGERVPVAELIAHDSYIAPTPKDFKFEEGIMSIMNPVSKRPVATIGEDLTLALPKGKQITDMDFHDVKRVYALGRQMAGRMIQAKQPITLSDKPKWFELDLAEYIIQQTDNSRMVVFPSHMTRESAQVESIAQKLEAIQEIAAKVDPADMMEGGQFAIRSRYIFNLPRKSSYEMGLTGSAESLPEILARLSNASTAAEIRNMSIADVKKALAEYNKLGDMAPTSYNAEQRIKLAGNSFTYGTDKSGTHLTPIIGLMEPMAPHQWNMEYIATNLAARKATTMAILNDSADLTQLLHRTTMQSPDVNVAFSVDTLRDTQLTGNPFSNFDRFSSAILSSDFIARNAPALRAMIDLRDTLTRVNNGYTARLFQETLGDSLNTLANPANRQSKLLLDSYFSFGRGWDKASPIQQDGLHVFPLADTEANRARFLAMTGREMPDGQLMLSPRGVLVALDDKGLDIVNRFNVLSTTRLDNANSLLEAQGLPQIARKDYHVPSPRVNGKFVGFTTDASGQLIPGRSIIAETEIEFARKKQALEAELNKEGNGHFVRSLGDIQSYGDIWDNAAFEFADPSHPINASKGNRGILTQQDVEPDAFLAALDHLRLQFNSHTNHYLRTIADDSIKGVKSRISAFSSLRATGAKVSERNSPATIYDRWLDAATGRSRIDSAGSIAGQISGGVEGMMDKLLGGASASLGKVQEGLGAWWHRANPFSDSEAAAKDFKSLSDALGKYMPIEDHAKWLETHNYGKRPWDSREASQQLNGFTATVTLRVMESAHAIMTAGGLVSAMPAVMRNLQKKAGESVAEWQARTANFGISMVPDGGKSVGVVDMTKITNAGIKALFDPDFANVLDQMAARGMTSQEVAEFTKQLAILKPRNSWGKAFFGDSSIANPSTLGEHLRSKGLINSASLLTDQAEHYSRMLSSATGYKLAEHIGIAGQEARLRFAQNFANKVIANYNPSNRPTIFQGPLGAQIGLFKTFSQNFYQRLYGYVEQGDWRALSSQFVSQGAMFGLPSMPGWALLDQISETLSDGESSLTDAVSVNNRAIHDLLMGGTLANLPKLFGAEAMSIYSRGDTNLRMPSGELGLANQLPSISVISKIMTGMWDSAKALSGKTGEFTSQRLGEILSNSVVNRPIGGLIELAMAGGYDTDRYGQTVNHATTGLEQVYRAMGIRTMAQEEQVRAFYRSKPAQEQQAAMRSNLNLRIRSAVRDGSLDSVYDLFQQEYVEKGGDPRRFRQVIANAIEAAKFTRSERELVKALKNGTKANDVTRYLDAGTAVMDDEIDIARDTEVLNALTPNYQDESPEAANPMALEYEPMLGN